MAYQVETDNFQGPADQFKATIPLDAGHTPISRHSAFWSQYFYFYMSLLGAAVIIYGFSHTIDQNLIHPKIPRPKLLYFHAALFTVWLAFFILQSLLVRTHNVRIHRMIGWFGVGMGSLIPLVGIATAITMAKFDMTQLKMNNADADMIIPIWDMVAFTPAFVLAIYWRRKPEFHRRLQLIAICILTAAGWGRFPEWLLPPIFFYAGVDLLILLGVLRDWMVNRKIHPVYLYALPALLAGQTAVMYANVHRSAAWMIIAHAVLG
jgi:hypothetical protein